MKYLLTILLVGLVATCYAALECPLEEDMPTYHPDPESCRYFYQCSNGAMEKLDCGESLVFHEELQVCDFPSNVPQCSHMQESDPKQEENLEFIELM